MAIKCKRCGKTPNEISEYVSAAKLINCTPDEFVKAEEGTFNEETDFFLCTSCYVSLGMPLGVAK